MDFRPVGTADPPDLGIGLDNHAGAEVDHEQVVPALIGQRKEQFQTLGVLGHLLPDTRRPDGCMDGQRQACGIHVVLGQHIVCPQADCVPRQRHVHDTRYENQTDRLDVREHVQQIKAGHVRQHVVDQHAGHPVGAQHFNGFLRRFRLDQLQADGGTIGQQPTNQQTIGGIVIHDQQLITHGVAARVRANYDLAAGALPRWLGMPHAIPCEEHTPHAPHLWETGRPDRPRTASTKQRHPRGAHGAASNQPWAGVASRIVTASPSIRRARNTMSSMDGDSAYF